MQTSAFGPVGTLPQAVRRDFSGVTYDEAMRREIGRASCRERV